MYVLHSVSGRGANNHLVVNWSRFISMKRYRTTIVPIFPGLLCMKSKGHICSSYIRSVFLIWFCQYIYISAFNTCMLVFYSLNDHAFYSFIFQTYLTWLDYINILNFFNYWICMSSMQTNVSWALFPLKNIVLEFLEHF